MEVLCADLQASVPLDVRGFVKLSRQQVCQLLDEVRDPALQCETARLLFEIFSADHRMVRAESILLWEALDHWGLYLREITGVSHDQTRASESPLLRTVGVPV